MLLGQRGMGASPMPYAHGGLCLMPTEAYEHLMLLRKAILPSNKGSIRLAWENTNSDRAVRLVCPINADKKSYIYPVSGEQDSKDITSAATLVYWLEWFKKV